MRTISSVFFLFLVLTSSVAAADDAFYETRLASGKQAYAEKRMPDAMADLRIAAFGFLDRPALLSETLVWLTLAESTSGRPDMVRWALTRFLEVETKFHPYKQLAIDAALRGKFEKILVATLSPDAIASIPTLSDLIAPVAGRAPASRDSAKPGTRTTPPPVAVIPVSPPPTKPIPPNTTTSQPSPPASQKIIPPPPPAAQASSSPGVPQQTGAVRGEPSSSMPPVVPKRTADSTSQPVAPAGSAAVPAAETIEKAKDLLQQNKNDDALRILKDLVARSPSRTARKYLLHAATRTHNWQTATVQIPELEPFHAGEEVTMFYAAVALYQTGKLAAARPLLERSLPGINPSPYVDSYKQKIMGR